MMTRPFPGRADEAWGAVSIAGALVFSPALAPWYRRWGATTAERDEALPGDGIVSAPRLQPTRAIDI